MAKLIYASNMSLDGCTEDARGGLDWGPRDDDLFASITQLMRSAGTYLYGRHMYETLAVWETDSPRAAQSELMAELKTAAGTDLLIGGPNLAAQALVAGLVDELALFVWPIVLGGRNPALATETRAGLELIDEHRFNSGVVSLRYRVRR